MTTELLTGNNTTMWLLPFMILAPSLYQPTFGFGIPYTVQSNVALSEIMAEMSCGNSRTVGGTVESNRSPSHFDNQEDTVHAYLVDVGN